MRPITNLKSNPEFKLPKDAIRTGFISAYNGQFGMNVYDFAILLPLRLIYPWARQETPAFESKSMKEWINFHIRDNTRRVVIKSSLRKNQLNKSIEYRTPLFRFMAPEGSESYLSNPGAIARDFKFPHLAGNAEARTALLESVKNLDDTEFAGGRLVSGKRAAELAGFTGRTADILTNSLAHVEAVRDGMWVILFATWRISQKEAEYLNNVPFGQIKLGNLYPTLLEWSATVFGKDTNLPDTLCPISSITAGVEAIKAVSPVKPRVGIEGCVVDVNRNFFKLPNVNDAQNYEQMLLEFGTQEDGSYTWAQRAAQLSDEVNIQGQGIETKKLPKNMPIYADWVNDKFVYSNSAGNLSIYDLSETAPLSNFHLNLLLNEEVDTSGTAGDGMWSVVCTAVDLASHWNRALLAEKPTFEEITNPNARGTLEEIHRKTYLFFREMAKDAFQLHLRQEGTDNLFVGKSGAPAVRVHQLASLPAFRWLFTVCANALSTLEANIDAMYARYSVMNVLQQLAVLDLLVKYAPKQAEVHAADMQDREVYLTQGVDPDYQVESVPLVKDGLKYMPHQNKTHNIMRRGPKNAVYPVDAGGGKTIIILTNILLELKKKHCQKPVIVCPSHLVAQYVKEVAFVTEGRLNLIPITNTSFKMHGEKKLKQFMEKAPINTVVVTDMNFLRGRKQRVAYGNKTLDVYRNAEFMRQFEFDLCAIDEVHYLKNFKSGRREAVGRFFMDIPMKRIASGTLVSDTILDLASQIALVDPVVFGSQEEFKREFGDKWRGGKVLSWKPGAEAEVRKRIAEHCVVATARRKEWAALLPPKRERFIPVDLTHHQRLLYDSILAKTMELIEEAMRNDPEMRELMSSEDDSLAEELSSKLRPYLARLEKFLSAPGDDETADLFLQDEDDRISPKVKAIYKILSEHGSGLMWRNRDGTEQRTESGPVPGKVLIFTQYTASAEAVYQFAPPELKKHMIHYTADRKAECKTEFENNPDKWIMVGVSQSMDTGLNLQFASRLIRMETVWTPGVLEQGNSRINRPEIKKSEDRDYIYMDWLIINRTVDITKVGRLISKIISKAKFDEHDNPEYAAIPALPQIAMTMDSIQAHNDFQEELLPYLEAYQTYQQVEEEDFRRYKEEQGDNIVFLDVPTGGLLEGSKLMSRVPYVPEMELYGVDKLGLVRYDHFVRQDMSALDEDDTDTDSSDEEDENDPKAAKKKAMMAQRERERPLVTDRPVHTEYGDGVIVWVGNRKLRVRLADGTTVLVQKLATYVITRSTTNGVDMRNELLKQVGKIPLDAPITVPVEEGVQDTRRRAKKGAEDQVAPQPDMPVAEFDFTVMNDFLGMMYRGDGSDTSTVDMLQNFGFRITQPYLFTKIPGPINFLKLMKGLSEQGFTLTKENSEELKRIHMALKVNKKAMNTFGFATQMDMTNFFRAQVKPSSDQKLLRIYPLVQDGKLYLLFPLKGQPANQKARRVQVGDLKWQQSQDTEMLRLFGTKKEALDVLKEMLAAGVNIPKKNLKELEAQFKAIKLVPR